MKGNNKLIGIAALTGLNGIGPSFVRKVVSKNTFESPDVMEEIKEIIRVNKKEFDDNAIYEATEKAKEIIFKCKEEGIKMIDFKSIEYPLLLGEIKDPPPILYCKGNTELFHNKTVCIIGTRQPNINAIKISERISKYYSNFDWTICNGLAEGVDSYALKSEDKFYNKIIGVLAGGLNYNTNKTLQKKTLYNAERTIESGGLLVSEIPPDVKEDTYTVLKSCRIQAGLSNGIILVQSSMEGGSRYTIKAFCSTKRPFATVRPVQADFDLPSYSGNKEIILNGKKGLVGFTGLKEDRIKISEIYIIESKGNYPEFEALMAKTFDYNIKSDQTLFN